MRIFMAGGVSGNLKPFWRYVSTLLLQGMDYREAFDAAMKVFLAGGESRHWIQEGYAGLSRGPELASPPVPGNIRGGGFDE